MALLPLILRGEPQTVHTLYLPVMVHDPYPDCERLEGVGLAWLDNSPAGAQQDLTNYCASMYYNNSGHNYADLHPNEIVMIWGNASQHYAAALSVPSTYCGYVLVLNEPGIHGQYYAPTGQVAAAAYAEMSPLLPPCAKRISPNLIIQTQSGQHNSIAYLSDFLDWVQAYQGFNDLYAVGVHIYGAEQTSATTKLNWVAAELASRGLNIPIIVSEYGVFPSPTPRALMHDITYQVATHAGVEAFFGYTVRNSQNAVPFELAAGPWPVNFSDSGRGWFGGLVQSGGIQ